MASTETLKIIITLKDTASRGIKALGSTLGNLRSKLNGIATGMTGLKALLAGVGGGLLARSFIQAADTAEQYRVRLNVLLGSQKEGNRLFKEMADFAGTVSFQYEEIMGAATNLAGVMKGGVDEVQQWMPLIADLAAASGLSIQDTTSNIIRMYSAGAASADMFRDRGILAMLGFQSGVAYSAEETRKRLIAAFEDPFSKFRGASKELAKTWSGMLSMLSDRWFQFRNMVMEAGVFDYIKAALQLWLDYMQKLQKEGRIDEWAQGIAKTIITVMGKIAIAVGWVADAFRGWQMIWQGLKMTFALLGQGMMAVIRGINTGITALLTAYQKLLELQKKLGDGIASLGEKLQAAAEKIPAIGGEIGRIGEGIKGLGEAFATSTQAGIDKIDAWKENLKGVSDETRVIDQWLEEILQTSYEKLMVVAAEVPYHERVKKVLEEINALIEAQKKAREDAAKAGSMAGGRPPEAGPTLDLTTRLQGEIARFNEKTKTLLAQLDAKYEQALVTTEEYFAERRRLAEEAYNYELERLKKLADAAPKEKPEEGEKIALEIYKLQEAHQRELLALELDRAKAIKDRIAGEKDAAQIIEDAKGRAATTGEFGLATQFAEELRELENRQREEQDRLKALKEKGYADEQQMQDLHNAQLLEKDKLLADQRWRLQQEYLNRTKSVISDVGSAFLEYYKATGERHKEFFEIYKAAAIAETIISTYQAAQDAYKATVGLPYVGPALAVAAAAAAIAAGMARVAAIRAQAMAEGGLVRPFKQAWQRLAAGGPVGAVRSYIGGGRIMGYSPHEKADNVPIRATAGEFMHPVQTVKYYGVQAMEAIRKRLVPPELIQQFAYPNVRIPSGANLAAGGLVMAPARGGGPAQAGDSYSVSVPITTIDTMDGLVGRMQGAAEEAVRKVLQEELG